MFHGISDHQNVRESEKKQRGTILGGEANKESHTNRVNCGKRITKKKTLDQISSNKKVRREKSLLWYKRRKEELQ